MLEILNRLDFCLGSAPAHFAGWYRYLSQFAPVCCSLRLPRFRLIFVSDEEHQGDVSRFAALCTALAATVGTGNIIGVNCH